MLAVDFNFKKYKYTLFKFLTEPRIQRGILKKILKIKFRCPTFFKYLLYFIIIMLIKYINFFSII